MTPRLNHDGLTAQEAAVRLAREGPNIIPSQGSRNWLRIIFDVIAEPMFALLLVASAIYLILGDLTEALVLAAFATFSVSIALVQEIRSERVLEALRDMTSPRALVVREGERKRIAGREVVRGDLIILSEGDRVAADAWVVRGEDFSTDESLLTGESAPVRKRAAPHDKPCPMQPGGEDLPYVFSGTLVVRGQGEAVVLATGANSAIGKIGSSLAAIRTETPRLRQETRRIVRIFAVGGLAISVTAGVLYGLAEQSWINGVLSGIAVGMSLLPEEFPLVLAVFMVMGAWRIAQARVLTRRAASIETLGAVTVLCTDKTGTLTLNRMEVAHIETGDEQWRPDQLAEPAQSVGRLTRIATLASLPKPFDPMERAVQKLLQSFGLEPSALFAQHDLAHRQGVTPELFAMIQVWRRNGAPALAAVKGAPEAIISLCKLEKDEERRILGRTSDLASQGMRVLAVAETEASDHAGLSGVMAQTFTFLGLIGFQDPVRDSVPGAVRECRDAGIRVVMITGDYPETARAIARTAGLNADKTLSGNDLKEIDNDALRQQVRTCDVFARILPEQKLRLIEALKSNGEIVGMTGDGVNDAPSLRAAHIGIAMGGRGTDVAREASSIVLLDDDFGSIVKTIRLGRRIFDNLQKAMGYILAVHAPIAGLALLPLAFGAPPILTPAIIAFLEMIIDPACSIVFEAEGEESDVMSRPPRDPRAHLLDRSLVIESVIQGAIAFLAVAAVYMALVLQQRDLADTRAVMLVALTMTNIALLFSHRSLKFSLEETFGRGNALLWFGVAIVAAVLAFTLAVPATREIFRLGDLKPGDLVATTVTTLSLLVALLTVKYAWEKRRRG